MKLVLGADTTLPTLELRSADVMSDKSISAFAGRQPAGYYDPPHTHDRGQFSYRTEGFASVKADGRNILLSPGRGVWIPAGVSHEVACQGPAAYNALYVDPAASPQSRRVRVIAVSPLLHALVESSLLSKQGGVREQLIARLILEEIAQLPDVSAVAPVMPRSQGLRMVCDRLFQSPGMRLDLNEWVALAGMSRRSFTRSFRHETGVSLGEWYQQLRMHFADTWLAEGIALKKIAFQLGYGSTASFSRAYSRVFGCSIPDNF